MRLARTPDGVFADPTGKMNGRGAYIHANQECLQAALKDNLETSLRVSLSAEDRERLIREGEKLPGKKEEQEAAEEAA